MTRQGALIALTMLLSGFAGISYEILYGRVLADIVGDQFAVSASILITFLLGIGLGSMFAHRLWRWLWLIEAGIGAYGLAMAVGARAVDALLYASVPLLPEGLVGSIVFCVLLLMVPAFLIGCSVPLFAGYFSRIGPGGSFAHVYAIYNFGAALTAFAIEFVLVRALGIRGAVMAIAAVNGVVAFSLAVLFRDLATAPAADEAPRLRVSTPRRHVVALALVSVASAIFQLFMVKLAELTLGPFRETFAIVLSLVLLGIALGSLAVRRWRPSFQAVLFAALGGTVFLALALRATVWMYASHYQPAAESYWVLVALKWLMLAALMGVPAIAFGAAIPALLTEQGDVARESGELLFVSSIANAAGFLLMTLVLHRHLEYGSQLLVIVALIAAALVVCRPLEAGTVITTASLVGSAVVVLASVWSEDFLYLSYTAFRSRDQLESDRARYQRSEVFRGSQDVFSILWRGGSPYLFINGYVSIPLNNPSEMMVGAISSIYSPRTDRAVVLGLGSGGTASAVGLLFDHTDVVEINPVIRDNIGRMARWNFDIEHNEKVDIIVDDGIHHLKRTDARYSLVLNTVTTPIYFSSSKLYTRDFFEVVKRRLTPDGVYMTWMDSRIGDRGAEIVLATLRESFEHCSLLAVKRAYFLLLCSAQPIVARDPELAVKSPVLSEKLLREHDLEPRWLAYHYLVKDAFALLPDEPVPINEADAPVLEFEMARLHQTGVPRLNARILDEMSWQDVKDAVRAPDGADPGALRVHIEEWLGKDSVLAARWRELLKDVPGAAAKSDAARLAFARRRASTVRTADARYQLALVLKKQGRIQEAMTELREALAISPRQNDAHYMLARCHEDLGEVAAALEHAHQEQELDPGDPDLPALLARLEAKLAAAAPAPAVP